jgi:hypothetical protein
VSVTVTLIEGPRRSGKTFVLHALGKAVVEGRTLMLDEADIALFLENPKLQFPKYWGQQYDDIFLVGPNVVKMMTQLVAAGIIPLPFNVRFVNLAITEITADDYPNTK